ncbi:MAG: polyprenyl synthetase family protein [Pseudomonadota bacterium]
MQSSITDHLLSQSENVMRVLVDASGGHAAKAALEHLESGGKRIRARLSLSAALSLELPSSEAISIASACELIHNASLVHDDIQDKSETRRGALTLCARYGNDIAICAGDLLISAAYAALAQTNSLSTSLLIGRAHKRIAEVISGQCKDLTLQANAQTDVETYQTIATLKSAPLLALPLELPLIQAGHLGSCSLVDKASKMFALAYQMADDIEDVTNDARLGRPNIVSVLGGQSESSPQVEKARKIAAKHYESAAKFADQLPLDSGTLLAAYARKGAVKLTPLGAAA